MDEGRDDPLAEAYNRGLAAEKSGDHSGAAMAFRQALALAPDDPGGVAVRLAALGAGPVPDRASPAYVATLFDQHAGSFDEILVERLGYRVPWLVAARLEEMDLGPFQRMLDLGCGTGLAGAALADQAAEIVGVDLSEEILAEADDRGVYDALFVGDAVQFLTEEDVPADLIVATDVLPYLGDLGPFFGALEPCLRAGGVVALSTEAGSQDWSVGPGHRFLHSEAYLRRMLSTHGLDPLDVEEIVVRLEEGVPAPGHLIIAQKPTGP